MQMRNYIRLELMQIYSFIYLGWLTADGKLKGPRQAQLTTTGLGSPDLAVFTNDISLSINILYNFLNFCRYLTIGDM